MAGNENPYASPCPLEEAPPTPEALVAFETQRQAARRMVRLPAIGVLATSSASAALALWFGCAVIITEGFGSESKFFEYFVSHWYLTAIPFAFYFILSFLGSLSLLVCRNHGLGTIACGLNTIPVLSPLFPISIPFGVLGLRALDKPEVRQVFHQVQYGARSNRDRALARLFWPAAFLLMGEALTAALVIWPFVMDIIFYFLYGPEPVANHFHEILHGGAGIRLIVMAVGCVLVTYSAIQMLRGRQYAACVVGALISSLPFLAACIFFGIPLGIWALVVLLQKETRAAFGKGT